MASASEAQGLKRFGGEEEDPGKQLKKWKTWACAKLMTFKDMRKEQRGPWILTLLDGKAWDSVEHLTLEQIASAEGEQLLWSTLQERFPEKEQHDVMGEVLGDVFGLVASEGETMKMWTARVKEVFDVCKRKASVEFPPAARGWVALHCAGLSEEQKAIVKAKTQGSLDHEAVSAALRSCFPLYKAAGGRKKATGVFQVEPLDETEKQEPDDDHQFQDVEAFLAEHDAAQASFTDDAVFSESETAEALAVSWKERRKEIAKFQQSRQFGSASSMQSKRQFRVQVEELKKRTRCRRCGKIGRWQKECKETATSSSTPAVGASYVEVDSHDTPTPAFVGLTECLSAVETLAANLVSSPGFGVVDSGCGRTLIGRETLAALEPMIQQKGYAKPTRYHSENTFRFGNGAVESSQQAVRIPCGIGHQYGIIDAAVISGHAPLLLGRPTLEKLKAQLDFSNGKMVVCGKETSMVTNPAGQLLVDVLAFPVKCDRESTCHAAEPCLEPSAHQPSDQAGGIKGKQKTKITLKKKECRCLLAQSHQAEARTRSKVLVAELFSPPRFSLAAEQLGHKGLSFDIKQGWDLEDAKTQKQVDKMLEEQCPALLVVSPECRHRGGWDHLNRRYRTPLEQARLIQRSRRQILFCKQQVVKQIKRGGEFLWEHPLGSEIWEETEVKPLKRKYGLKRVDMCAYGLKCPDSCMPIHKPTGLLVSSGPHHDLSHIKTCPGCARHRQIAGKLKSGQNVSAFAAAYTQDFVKHMLFMLVPWCKPEDMGAEVLLSELDLQCLAAESAAPAVEPEQALAPPNSDQGPGVLDARDDVVKKALKRLHVNLGHPSNKDLVRILKHSRASETAIRLAQDFTCAVCQNHVQPSSALPAKSSRHSEFNERVGLDVKYLPGWKPNQQVPCISIVDYATSLQIVAPIFERESAEVLKGVLRDSWIAWAGPPQQLEMDPSKPNLSEALGHFCETMGIDQLFIAADSHWQLGKVERHGHWFQKIFERVLDDCRPSSPEEFVDCVLQTQCAKNSLITEHGASPYQLVFGRNPRVPTDLLQEEPHLAASDSILADAGVQRSNAVRQAARMAVLQCQDSRAFRAALRARPRPRKELQSGDWVYYWRTQKWEQGSLIRGGRWHGAGMLLGRIGINWIVAHRRSLFRCSPEQIRPASQEERTVAEFDAGELLGIKNLLERGQFPKGQFVDLVNMDNPPQAEQLEAFHGTQHVGRSEDEPLTAAEIRASQLETSGPTEVGHEVSNSEQPVSGTGTAARPRTEDYGPIRRVRHTEKSPPQYLTRPAVMAQEDFAEMMEEVIPSLIQQHLQDSNMEPERPTSPRGESSKREASWEPLEQPAHRPRIEVNDEVLFTEVLLAQARDMQNQTGLSVIDSFTAAFLQKRQQKEIKAWGNEPELQHRIDLSKGTEWETLEGKDAVRVWRGAKAAEIRARHPDRFIGSRFVVVNKHDEEGERIKSRWCLQGHLDPDFHEKISSGACHSPTMHPLSRALLLQVIVSKKWELQLGDIKGAFLEAGPIDKKYRPLFAEQPPGGVPGLDPSDVIEVLGNVYGSNDAPMNWWGTFDQAARETSFVRSQFDSCMYMLRDNQGHLCGILGSHVDDTITAGEGPVYEAAIAKLKERFPYRKWRRGNGEFCGVVYNQDPVSKEITFNQKEYAQHMRPICLTKERARQKESNATEKEISVLRAVNGAANWVSSQSRPDLCVQTSFSQQCFPDPKVSDLHFANQLVHRAKQYSDVEITVKHIPWDSIELCFHSDAGFGNAKGHSTQAGYIAAFVDGQLKQNQPSVWSPFAWKSYRLPRKVACTLGGEAQAFSTASAVCEWMALMLVEAKHGPFDLRTTGQVKDFPPTTGAKTLFRDEIERVPITGITDCKSLFDNITSVSAISKQDDKRIAIDLGIIKQSMLRCGLTIRWCPTELMLADGLTKDSQEAADLLRSALALGEYQLHPEAQVLARKKKFRNERQARRVRQMQWEAEQQERKKNSTKGQGKGHR